MGSHKYNVIVSDRAKQMLARHLSFMSNSSVSAAKATKNTLTTALRSLETMPDRFPFLNEDYITANKYHKMYVKKWYIVLYQVRDDTVNVDYIIDGRQDYSWIL